MIFFPSLSHFQQFDAVCKAEVALFITRAFINVSDKLTKFPAKVIPNVCNGS